MSKEIEYKFLLTEDQVPAFLKWLPLQQVEGKTKRVISTYFDTPKADLRNRKIAYRVRKAGDAWLQTVKGEAPSKGGLSVREEVETPLDSDQPNFDAFRATAFETTFTDTSLTARLKPLFVTDFERTKWIVCIGDSSAEVVLDRGFVIAGQKREAILEVEMELQSGNVTDLASLSHLLRNHLPLPPGNESKAQRGYRLVSGA